MTVQLQIWREVSQHLDIEESLRRIRDVVGLEWPLRRLAIRTVRLDPPGIATLADSRVSPTMPVLPTHEPCSRDVMRALADLAGSADVRVLEPGRIDAALKHLLGPIDTSRGSVLVGGLGPADPMPTLLIAEGRSSPSDDEVALFGELLDPVAIAIRNDLRIHELQRLRNALEADNRALRDRLGRQDIAEAVVGAETGLREAMLRLEQVAPTDAPVLLLGETGSGKEVAARTLHARSARGDGPMLRVNCGAIAPELLDSELFGHEKGAFTGAASRHRGWFERADGGTLFLDEIGELPAAAQVRLLRVLQDGTLTRVGAQDVIRVDVRIVAATHRDLRSMVAAGTFREDLWYRLSVFPIHLPPLRERLGDLPALARHFAASAGRRLGGGPLHPSDADIALLSAYRWPGNVRELAAVIERAAILGNGRSLRIAEALGSVPGNAPDAGTSPIAPTPIAATPSLSDVGGTELDAAIRVHIEEALRACRGRVDGPFGAAERLGVHPQTLRSRMKRLGVEWKQFRR